MKRTETRLIRGSALALIVAGAASCATPPLLREQMESTTRTIRAAERVGARDVPRAAQYIRYAEEEAQRAKLLLENPLGDRSAATSWLIRAEVDAELACALSGARCGGELPATDRRSP